jgi:hypothetical protein
MTLQTAALISCYGVLCYVLGCAIGFGIGQRVATHDR